MRCTWLHKGLPRDDGATVVGSVPSLRYGIHPQGDYDKEKVPTGCIVSIVSEYIDRTDIPYRTSRYVVQLGAP